jgi:hypothetical protein
MKSKCTYELYYSNGGHGGPYLTLTEAKKAAKRLLEGSKTMIAVEIRPSNSGYFGGYNTRNNNSFFVRKKTEIYG